MSPGDHDVGTAADQRGGGRFHAGGWCCEWTISFITAKWRQTLVESPPKTDSTWKSQSHQFRSVRTSLIEPSISFIPSTRPVLQQFSSFRFSKHFPSLIAFLLFFLRLFFSSADQIFSFLKYFLLFFLHFFSRPKTKTSKISGSESRINSRTCPGNLVLFMHCVH